MSELERLKLRAGHWLPNGSHCELPAFRDEKHQEEYGRQRAKAQKELDEYLVVNTVTVFGYFDDNRFNFTPQIAFGSMLLRRKELDAAVQAGKFLSVEEQKERTILRFFLGSPNGEPDDQPLIKFHKLNLEEMKDIRAISEFTFGDIKKCGASLEGVKQFFEGIHSGIITIEEAKQILAEAEQWNKIKDQTQLSKEEFFAKKLFVLTDTKKNHPLNN